MESGSAVHSGRTAVEAVQGGRTAIEAVPASRTAKDLGTQIISPDDLLSLKKPGTETHLRSSPDKETSSSIEHSSEGNHHLFEIGKELGKSAIEYSVKDDHHQTEKKE